jgi:serine/threonine protein phosphatase PrpC
LTENPLSKESNLRINREKVVGTHSATLDVNTSKNQKLEPIQKINKIHYVVKTKAGTTGKQTKINQDIAIVDLKLLFGLKLFSVCDGHGINGHLVSSFIKTNLISK